MRTKAKGSTGQGAGLISLALGLLAAGCYDLTPTPFLPGGEGGGGAAPNEGPTVSWVTQAESTQEIAPRLAAFTANELVVAGTFMSEVTLGKDQPTETVLTTTSAVWDIFVAHYLADGTLVGARQPFTGLATLEDLGALSDGRDVLVGGFGELEPPKIGPEQIPLVTHGGDDGFIALFEPDGTPDWAIPLGGLGSDVVKRVALGSGLVLVSGTFEGAITLGEGPTAVFLGAEGGTGMFLAAYSEDGALTWAKEVAGKARPLDLVERDGTVLVTGSYQGAATFEPGKEEEKKLDPMNPEANENDDVFIAKYNALDGTFSWARRAGGSGADQGVAALVREDGSIDVSGSYSGNVTFEDQNIEPLAEQGSELFLAHYTLDGTLDWVRQAGGAGDTTCTAMAGFADGSMLVGGQFANEAAFGTNEPRETTIVSVASRDMFLALYNGDGTLQWAASEGGAGENDSVSRVVVPAPESSWALVSGLFEYDVTFDLGTGAGPVLESEGDANPFVMRLDVGAKSD